MSAHAVRTQPRAKVVVTALQVKKSRRVSLTVVNSDRPRTRSECGTQRPCPWVSCKHHLYLDICETGAVKLNFPHLEVEDMKETCSLDVAERHVENGMQEMRIAELLNVSRQAVANIERSAVEKLMRTASQVALDADHVVEVPKPVVLRPRQAPKSKSIGRPRTVSLWVLSEIRANPGLSRAELKARTELPIEKVERSIFYLKKSGSIRAELSRTGHPFNRYYAVEAP